MKALQHNNLKIAKRLFPKVDFAVLSASVQKLFTACSEKPLGDCYEIHSLAVQFLKQNGVEAKLIAGDAAWRIGSAGGAVVSHVESGQANTSQHVFGMKKMWFHCWLQLNDYWFLDLSAYQLSDKMRHLDFLEQTYTPVCWKPDFLIFNKSQVKPFNNVANGFKSGLFYYQENKMKERVLNEAALQDSSDEHLKSLDTIYRSLLRGNNLAVYGPNSLSNVLE